METLFNHTGLEEEDLIHKYEDRINTTIPSQCTGIYVHELLAPIILGWASVEYRYKMSSIMVDYHKREFYSELESRINENLLLKGINLTLESSLTRNQRENIELRNTNLTYARKPRKSVMLVNGRIVPEVPSVSKKILILIQTNIIE